MTPAKTVLVVLAVAMPILTLIAGLYIRSTMPS